MSDLRELLDADLDADLGDSPPHRPLEERVAAGRRAVRRRRRLVGLGSLVGVAVLVAGSVLVRPAIGPGGGIDLPPPPSPAPTPGPPKQTVHLLVAPQRFVRPDTPPVLYLFGRMFKRSRGVTVLATYGEIDVAPHPQGAAIVKIGSRTEWVLVVGNEPERLDEVRVAPYDYQGLVTWATQDFPVLSGRLALAATAPGPYRPASDGTSPAGFAGDHLVARPGGTVVQRIVDPVADRRAVRPCHAQAVRVCTATGDWFALGFDCPTQSAVYSERVGVRAQSLVSWLTQVKRAQAAFEG